MLSRPTITHGSACPQPMKLNQKPMRLDAKTKRDRVHCARAELRESGVDQLRSVDVTQTPVAPSLDSWQSNQLQIVVFPKTPMVGVNQNWWRQVTGRDPDETSTKKLETSATGEFNEWNLVLTVDLLRIIWTLSPKIDPANPSLGMPILGAYAIARDAFLEAMKAWIASSCPPIKRMAFVALLIQGAESHEDAYQLLQRYLIKTIQIDPLSTDFHYRINRRRRSDTTDLTINRLSTWSALKVTVSAQAFIPGQEQSIARRQIAKDQYSAFLQLDMNTDADREDEIPIGKLPMLVDELVVHADYLALNGDVP
jgi:hypothetical protein